MSCCAMSLPWRAQVQTQRIPPQSGVAFELTQGQLLRVSAPEGEQVSDMVAFNAHDLAEHLSNGKTFDYEETLDLSYGATLWSNRSRKMLRIVSDPNGQNDFLLAPCCRNTFELIYQESEPRPGCLGNLANALAPWGLDTDDIPTAFNIFMNVDYSGGRVRTLPPKVSPGQTIVFEALMDLVVGLTACSAAQSNNGSFKPIDYAIGAG